MDSGHLYCELSNTYTYAGAPRHLLCLEYIWKKIITIHLELSFSNPFFFWTRKEQNEARCSSPIQKPKKKAEKITDRQRR
jgi:hypothetical protein